AREAVSARPAEIALEVQQLSEPPVGQHRLDLAQRRLEAPVVADREGQLPLGARRDRAGGLLERQTERLLDEDMLPGLPCGGELFAVLRVGGGEDDGIDVAIQYFFVAFEKRDPLPLAEFLGARGSARAACDEADALAALDRAHEILSPGADTDDPRAQHLRKPGARSRVPGVQSRQ